MNSGDLIPDFTLPDQDGNPVTLSSFMIPVVLFFYPRADTSGCTTEACEFRDSMAELQGSGVTLLGISRDTVKAQKKFAAKYALPYPLLADPDETICNRFGLVKAKTMYGKPVRGIERTTYLIAPPDNDGKQILLHVWSKVKPEGHAAEVLSYLHAHPITTPQSN